MTCGKCKVSFCWVCKQIIKDKNPYDHFNKNQKTRWDNLLVSINELSALPCKFKTGCKTYSNEVAQSGKLHKVFLANILALIMSPLWAWWTAIEVVWFGWDRYLDDSELPFLNGDREGNMVTLIWLQGLFNFFVLLPVSFYLVLPFLVLFELINLTVILIKGLFCSCW